MYQQKKKVQEGKTCAEQSDKFLDLKKPKAKMEDEKLQSPPSIKTAAATILDANNQ